jgi:hypothetical protein
MKRILLQLRLSVEIVQPQMQLLVMCFPVLKHALLAQLALLPEMFQLRILLQLRLSVEIVQPQMQLLVMCFPVLKHALLAQLALLPEMFQLRMRAFPLLQQPQLLFSSHEANEAKLASVSQPISTERKQVSGCTEAFVLRAPGIYSRQ